MICVSKGYEIRTKMVQEQWLQLIMTLVFIWLNWLLVGGNTNLVGSGWMSKFLVGEGTPPSPPVEKTLHKLCQQFLIYHEEAPCTSHTSSPKVAILLLQDFSTLCVTDIYGIYFHFIQQIYHIMNRFNQAQWWKKNLSREYLSLNIIKHTCSWRNKFVVI